MAKESASVLVRGKRKVANTTVIVSPRERYSPIIESLQSLFSTISSDVPVIVVGRYPISLREKLRELSRIRPFHHEAREWQLIPNEARNIGTDLVETPYIAYCDNDMLYERGWLQALEAHADRTGVEVVAPVTCIGLPRARIIHHAGGVISVTVDDKGIHLKETMNLKDRSINFLEGANLPRITDTGEFHTIFVRTDFMRKIGVLDERLITREHIDFALRVMQAGGRIGFEQRALVTQNAWSKLEPGDLSYHVFRWSHEYAVRSLDAFERTWGLYVDRNAILKDWIRTHRRERIMEEFATIRRVAGSRFVWHIIAPMIEWKNLREFNRPIVRRLPHEIPITQRNDFIAELVQRTKDRAESLRGPLDFATAHPDRLEHRTAPSAQV
jgi:glycosyltransferase involved in cell wall biosynthesis